MAAFGRRPRLRAGASARPRRDQPGEVEWYQRAPAPWTPGRGTTSSARPSAPIRSSADAAAP